MGRILPFIKDAVGFSKRRIVDTKVFPIGWHVITVPAITPGEIRTDIEFKIPQDFKECWGVLFSATRNGLDARANILGECTIHFNSKERNVTQRISVRVKPLADQARGTITAFRRKYDVLKLDEKLLRGQLVQAEYKDTSAIPALVSYDLKIYLKGIRDNG